MKKAHRLFIIQIVIAVVLFIMLSSITKTVFLNNPKAKSYIDFNDGVKNMASSTSQLVDTLIAKNDLTFDPTSGKLLDKVLNNLKYAEDNKFLMIGSSQMRVVQGEDLKESYPKMVSRKVRQYTNQKYNTYNLSLGGMTTPEKLIMAKKAVEIIQPQRLLIAVTPWDALSDKVRPTVKAIENKKYQLEKKPVNQEESSSQPLIADKVFPINVNDKITESIDSFIEDKLTIYSKRAAIKTWLNTEIINELININDGVTKEEAFKTNIPEYWRTVGQDLDNIQGWEHKEGKSGNKSIKIVNNKSQNAKWLGDDIILETPTNTFEFEGWSKAENVSKAKLYCLDFQVIFVDGTSKWFYKGLSFKKGTHDWQQVKTRIQFDKKVKAIKPHLLFYGGTGTVWFDDIVAKPVYEGETSENILPNSSFELELKERQNVSYSYTKAEWERIHQNMFAVVDALSNQKTKEQNVLLLTPFWNNKQKTAYPQKAQYANLVEAVKNYCKQKSVELIDASYILTKDNFGVYTKGSVRDKIDVLHFNAAAHEKLANYIIKELNL